MYQRALEAYYASPPLALPDESAVADPNTTTKGLGGDGVLANVQTCHTARFRWKTPRMGQKYTRTRLNRRRPFERKRGYGAGRRGQCQILRESLMEWYNTIRHSVDCKLMTRFPKRVLLAQARMLQVEYYKSCLTNNLEPESVHISKTWLNRFMDEYAIASRRPNRKFKVARRVLAERLKIY